MSKIRLGPDGTHIFYRDSGTNILIEEVIPSEDRWTISPRQVSIALTNACDLECTHCYAPKSHAKMDLETVKQWMLELDNAGCFGIGFGGGEPTLYPKIVELCNFGSTNTNLAITITTHGHRLSESLVESLEQSVNFLRISMDGIYETYEKIRGRSFISLLKKLDMIKGRIPFGINFVVNETTISDLSHAVEIAEKYQAVEFLLLPEVAHGRGSAVKEKTLKQLSDWISSYDGNLRLSISTAYNELAKTQFPLPNESEEIAFAHIDANGVLKRNSFDVYGQVIDDNGVISAFKNLISQRKVL